MLIRITSLKKFITIIRCCPVMHRSAADVSHRALCAVLLLICIEAAAQRMRAILPHSGALHFAFCVLHSAFDSNHRKLLYPLVSKKIENIQSMLSIFALIGVT